MARVPLMIISLAIALTAGVCHAELARRGGGAPLNMQNRSVNRGEANRNLNARQNINTGQTTNVNRNLNTTQNVNVNRNVNVNTNYNYHGGGCYNCGYNDSGWNWGSFAAGAATTAVVGAAAHAAAAPPPVVVAAPAVGSVVTSLPGECATVGAGGAVIYSCNNIYYRPYYQGTTLVYEVVTHP